MHARGSGEAARRAKRGRQPEKKKARASAAPWVSKSTHPRKFGNDLTVHRLRPSFRTTGIPMFTLTLSSYFGSPGENWFRINVVINWQLSKQCIRWPVSPDQYHLTHPGRVFFEVIRWQVKSFQIIEGSSMFFKIHMKYGVFMSLWPRTIKIVISNWPWTRKFSQIYLIHSGKKDAFHFCHHSHALVTLYAQRLCSDWSKFDRRVHEEN